MTWQRATNECGTVLESGLRKHSPGCYGSILFKKLWANDL